MFREYNQDQKQAYCKARDYFIENPSALESAEKYIVKCIFETLEDFKDEIGNDYDEANYLFPFWGNYQPSQRGNKPKGDQIPWIEVGEHSIGHRVERLMGGRFSVREIGMPSGTDDRFLLSNSKLKEILKITSSVMIFQDVKSTGPRESENDLVLSIYQMSGDGVWDPSNDSVRNEKIDAVGPKATQEFQPSISPILCLSDGTIAPIIHIFLKPIYAMTKDLFGETVGQPLEEIKLVCVPNGLEMFVNPGFHYKHDHLLRPGKDGSGKKANKSRVRIDIVKLKSIDPWRVQSVCF